MPRFVVTRPYPGSNVGSNLASLAGAAWLARRLGRELIVDWRGMTQLRDPSLNYFTEFFETPSTIAGVVTRYAPDAGADYDGARKLHPDEAGVLASRGEDQPDDHLVLEQYHGPARLFSGSAAARFAYLRSVYRHVAPTADLRNAIDAWVDEHFDAPFVVGLNIRTGNGKYFGKGDAYAGRIDLSLFHKEDRFLHVISRACRRRASELPRSLRGETKIFYATDSEPMSRLLSRLPDAVTRRQRFPPVGVGDTYAFDESDYSDRDGVADTVADLFLLARCDALLYNGSMFNEYARVVTGGFSGNMVNFERLFLGRRLELDARRTWRAVRRRIG
ncbi:MAG TPA: nodulation protein NodZ [Gaiellaceae bacterium]|jgi:hypothetical protein